MLQGKREAFAELVHRHHPRLIRLCSAFLSDPVLAEDAAQEVFLKAYRGLRHYRGDSTFTTWLHRIAYRHCTDLLRSRKRHPTEALEDDLMDPTREISPAIESRELLQKTLNTLPEEFRTVLVLREVEGHSYDEMAQILDCSLDAVKSRVRRARESFLEKARKL